MHELSIASNIIEIATEQAEINNFHEIDEIEIEVGKLSGVEMDALKFMLEIVSKSTILKNSKVIYIEIPGYASCLECSKEFETDSLYAQCPVCKEFKVQIIRGKELRVKSLSVY